MASSMVSHTTSALRKLGIIQVAISGFFFGFLGIFGKALYEHGVTPGELLSLRFTIAAAILWPIVVMRFPNAWRLRPAQLLACASLGTLGYALFSSFFFMSLQGLSASLAVLLLYTYPVWVAAGAWILWREAIPKAKLPALPLALAGIALLVWSDFSVERGGAWLFGIAAAVFYALYILASSRLLRGIAPVISLTYILTSAGFTLSMLHWRDSSRVIFVIVENWPALLGIVAIGTLGAMGLFLAGLQKLKPWEVSLLSTLEPVTGVFLGGVLLGERMGLTQIIGAISVLGAMIVVSVPGRPRHGDRPHVKE